MNSFLPTSPEDQLAVTNFLIHTFKASPEVSSFRADVMFWKYFSPHPEWKGSRSYSVKHGDVLVAHGGVWPLRLIGQDREIRVIHLIDWAAARSAPGAGVLLLRKLAQMADVLLTLGGSSDTRAILPKLGYRQVGKLEFYARVVRPWRQFRTTPNHSWKAPLRLARNAVWSLGLTAVPPKWQAVPVSSFENSQSSLNGTDFDAGALRSRRTSTGLNYILRCPAARMSAFTILESQQQRGYFILAHVSGQTRIVEIRVNSEHPGDWLAACRLATRTAAENPDTCEIVTSTSQVSLATALRELGFRPRRSDPIFCYDPRNTLAGAPPFALTMLDGDLFFLYDPAHPYLT